MSKDKILIIEDDTYLREAICMFIEINGLEYVSAANGKEGLHYLCNEDVSIVVCDINLPDILGWDILKAVRNDPRLYNIPFIFLSAYADKKDVYRGLEKGADEYITKPFANKELMDAIFFWLDKAKKDDNLFSPDLNTKVLNLISKNLQHDVLASLDGMLNSFEFLANLPEKTKLSDLPVDMKISDLKQTLESVYSASIQMRRDLENFVALPSLTSNKSKELHLDKINNEITLNTLLHDIVISVSKSRRTNISGIYNGDVTGWQGSVKYISLLFTELLDNAIKFNVGPERPYYKLDALPNGGFEFSVTNGVPPDLMIEADKIAPYRKFHEDISINGLGLGLYLAKSLCQIFGYEFSINNDVAAIKFVVTSTPITTDQ